MGIWDDIKNTFRNGSNLSKLIYLSGTHDELMELKGRYKKLYKMQIF